MKKPNKLYRYLGGSRSHAGAAFAVARHPVRSLRDAFGRDVAARDAAESFGGMTECRYGFQLVFATLKAWGKMYSGPKMNGLFSMMNRGSRPAQRAHQPD